MKKPIVVFARRAVINGRGTAPWKWVSGLSEVERAAVRSGSALVVIRDSQAWHHTQSGYKVCYWLPSGRYVHREPQAWELRAILGAGG